MASFGETLKRERELREISLRQVSEATKINIRYLEALEQNRFNVLPGGLFNKGFIRAYATYIGIDGEAMVNSYLHEVAAREEGGEPGAAREESILHRPAALPQRRADPKKAAPAPASAPPAPAPATGPGAGGAPGRDAAGAPAGEAVDPDWVIVSESPRPGPYGTQRPPSIVSISEVEAPERRVPSSRAVVWILSLVAGAALLFVILALLSRPKPVPPDLRPATTGTAGGGAADAAQTSALEALSAAQEISAPDPGGSPSGPSTGNRPPEPGAAGHPAASEPVASGAPPRSLSIASAGATPPESAGPEEAGAPAAGGARSPVESEEAPGPMRVEIETTGTTWVQLTCDSRDMISRYMHEGESATMECLSKVRVSATDAGAVHLSVNGTPCMPLGEPDTRAYGYTIRIDDYRKICRGDWRGTNGRP
jgi:cytoskeletal protein RodZ